MRRSQWAGNGQKCIAAHSCSGAEVRGIFRTTLSCSFAGYLPALVAQGARVRKYTKFKNITPFFI